MKRQGNLWYLITDFGNLMQAAKQAQRGKRHRDNVIEFNYRLEHSTKFGSGSNAPIPSGSLIRLLMPAAIWNH